MEKWFIRYNICILLILTCIILLSIRKFVEYNCKYKNCIEGNLPLKYIPKKIFQIVLSDKTDIHPKFLENIEHIKRTNPNWNYTLYDDKDIITYLQTYYPPIILYYYNKINPNYAPARADFFRYLLMYREGGVYLDLKSSTKSPLDNIIRPDDEYILSHHTCPTQSCILQTIKGEYQQWHIICRPNHPYLKAVIDRVLNNIENYTVDNFGVGKLGVLKVTGPIAYTQAISPIINNYNHRLLASSDFLDLIYNNLNVSHTDLYSKLHYSKIKEPVIK